MKKLVVGLIFFLSLAGVGTMSARAAERPFDIAIFSPVQLFPAEDDVRGLRLAIYGVKQNFTGLDIGLVKVTRGNWAGVGIGGQRVGGNAKGIMYGTFFNYVEGDFTGWQQGIANWSFGETTGLQTGIYNRGGNFTGLQLGLVNRVRRLRGLQIGLLNFHDEADQSRFPAESKFFPIVNWKF
jgi:hypothetical protein